MYTSDYMAGAMTSDGMDEEGDSPPSSAGAAAAAAVLFPPPRREVAECSSRAARGLPKRHNKT